MKKIAPDKWKHFWVAIPLGAVLYWLASLIWPVQHGWAVGAATCMLIAICYGFELFSKFTGLGHYDMGDVIAGVIGGITGIAALFFII